MDNMDYGFDTEFLSDDDVEEMINSLMTTIGEQIAEEEERTAVARPHKIRQLSYTYRVLKYLTKGMNGVKVTYEVHKPYRSMGSVSVAGKHIVLRKPEWFMKAIELSSYFDVFPKEDGTVQMDFTFHDLTETIE